MKNKYLSLIIFLILFFAFALPSWGAEFLVSPPRFEFTMTPNSSTTEAVQVTNVGEDKLEMQAYFMDWEMNKKGDLNYIKPGSIKTSCATWLKVNPHQFTLLPKESKIIRFTISAPPEKAGSYWTIMFVQPKEPIPHGQVGVAITGRVGVVIYATILGNQLRSGKILDMKVQKDQNKKYKLDLTFENTGNLHLRPKGWWEIKDAAGKKIKKGELEEFLVLPGFQRTREFILEEVKKEGNEPFLPPGKYTISVVLDYGSKELVGGDLTFETTDG